MWSDLSLMRRSAPEVEHESALRGCVDLVSLNVCQHCSCTSVHILCTPANVVTSALAQVFSKTVIHGIESQHSFNCCLFVSVKKAGAQRFFVDARESMRQSLRPPSGPLLTGEGLWHVEFQGALEHAQNWFFGVRLISNMRSIRCGMVTEVFCTARCSRV